MDRKRTTDCNKSAPPAKTARVVMTLKEKIKVLDKLASGISAIEVGHHYGVNESTIRSIKKVGDKIRKSVRTSDISAKVSCIRRRDPILEKMEPVLNLWMKEENMKTSSVVYKLVRSKALELYATVKDMENEQQISMPNTSSDSTGSSTPPPSTTVSMPPPFVASKGWFDRFLNRYNLHGLTRHLPSHSDITASSWQRTVLKAIMDRECTTDCNKSAPPVKKARVMMTLKEKIKVLDELASGISAAEVGRHHGVNESTIRSINKVSDKIRKSVRSSSDISAKVSHISRRDPILEKMEPVLNLWMEEQKMKKTSSVDYNLVRSKALELYATVKDMENGNQISMPTTSSGSTGSLTPPPSTTVSTPPPFVGSKGWFERFLNRYNLHRLTRCSSSHNDVTASSPSSHQAQVLYTFGVRNKSNSLQANSIQRHLSKSSKCLFCDCGGVREVELGKLHRKKNFNAHYYCLLFSSALEQNGEDEEGIYGFLPKDIEKESRRGNKLKCCHCGKKGATIGCSNKTCRKTYHFPCGLDNKAQFIFTDSFSSYCIAHRTYQATNSQIEDVECCICFETVKTDSKVAHVSPCCQKSGWFHSLCLKKLALSAGYFFKCPLCNDKDKFVKEMLNYGIYVPEKDASWELEPNAYRDLLERPLRCDALHCKCPSGRKFDEEGRWDIVLCHLCGSSGTHKFCSSLKKPIEWHCNVCSDMLNESAKREKLEARERRTAERKRMRDKENDENTPNRSKKRKLSVQSGDIINVGSSSLNDSKDVIDIESLSNYDSDNSLYSINSPSTKKVEFLYDVDLDENINPGLIISKLEDCQLTTVLRNFKDFSRALPNLFFCVNHTAESFISFISALSSGCNIKLEHIKSFLDCSLQYDRMVMLRRVIVRFLQLKRMKLSSQSNHRLSLGMHGSRNMKEDVLNVRRCLKASIEEISNYKFSNAATIFKRCDESADLGINSDALRYGSSNVLKDISLNGRNNFNSHSSSEYRLKQPVQRNILSNSKFGLDNPGRGSLECLPSRGSPTNSSNIRTRGVKLKECYVSLPISTRVLRSLLPDSIGKNGLESSFDANGCDSDSSLDDDEISFKLLDATIDRVCKGEFMEKENEAGEDGDEIVLDDSFDEISRDVEEILDESVSILNGGQSDDVAIIDLGTPERSGHSMQSTSTPISKSDKVSNAEGFRDKTEAFWGLKSKSVTKSPKKRIYQRKGDAGRYIQPCISMYFNVLQNEK